MRIYVACLASYNAGILHGRWIDASADVDAMQGEIDAMLKASREPGAEEWAVHDYDGVPSDLGEYPGLDKIAAFVALCEEFDHIDSDDVAAIAANWCGDLDQARTALQDDFCGIYPAFRDYADEAADEMIACYVSDAKIPQALINYFDYESHARDLAFSMTAVDVSTGVAVFHSA
jgi:antirestriction protein